MYVNSLNKLSSLTFWLLDASDEYEVPSTQPVELHTTRVPLDTRSVAPQDSHHKRMFNKSTHWSGSAPSNWAE